MCRRGHNPNWMACRVIENAPLIIAWLAMIVAIVENTTSATCKLAGIARKTDCLPPPDAIDHDRGLAGVIERRVGRTRPYQANRIGRGPK